MSRHTPKVALVTLGDVSDPGSYSGLPHGLHSSLVDLGFNVVAIGGRLSERAETSLVPPLALAELEHPRASPGIRREYWLARQRARDGSVLARLRNRRARILVGRIRNLDLVIQHGTEIDLGPTAVPLVTYEDSTLDAALAVRQFYAHLERAVDRTLETARRRTARVYGHVTAACFASSWAAQSALRDYGMAEDRVRVVGVGRNFSPASPRRDWSRPVFLWSGREWVRKGGPQLLEAFARVHARHPDAELHLVGRHPDVRQPAVHAHGEMDLASTRTGTTMSALYGRATCLVLPSLHEPAGSVIAEAATAGIGSIGGTSGGSATIIGDAGLVVPPGDVAALTAAMERFVVPGAARDFGTKAWGRAPLFTWDAVARRLVSASGLSGLRAREVTFLPLR